MDGVLEKSMEGNGIDGIQWNRRNSLGEEEDRRLGQDDWRRRRSDSRIRYVNLIYHIIPVLKVRYILS